MLPSESKSELRSDRQAQSRSRSNKSRLSEPQVHSNNSQNNSSKYPQAFSQSSGNGLRGLNADTRSYINTTFAKESDQILNEISECDPQQELTSTKPKRAV